MNKIQMWPSGSGSKRSENFADVLNGCSQRENDVTDEEEEEEPQTAVVVGKDGKLDHTNGRHSAVC